MAQRMRGVLCAVDKPDETCKWLCGRKCTLRADWRLLCERRCPAKLTAVKATREALLPNLS